MASANGAIRLLGAVAIGAQLDDLAGRFARASGHTVETRIDLNPAVASRILAGEPFDLGTTNPPYLPGLIAAGHVDAGTQRPFGCIPLALGARIAVVDAATRPQDIAARLTDARSIAYTGEGTSGRTFLAVAGRLGVLEAIESRLAPMGAGQPVAAVAAGDAELAVAPLTVVIASPGVEPVAVFPAALGADIEMAMFLATRSRNRSGALGLLDFLTDPSLDALLAAGGVLRSRS